MQNTPNRRFVSTNPSWYRQYRSSASSSASLALSPETEQLICAKERAVVSSRLPDYFPTPPPVVQRAIELAEIRSGQKVLEPSAGNGNIADALRSRADIFLEVIEIQPALREILALKGYHIVGDDFLRHQTRYDRIVMNPPFSGGLDSVHIRHAYECLRPNGLLVSVLCQCRFFRDDRKCDAFRNWLLKVGARVEKLPSRAFSEGDRPTYVPTSLLAIQKPRK